MIQKLICGIFDWDDNILHMPSLIRAYDKQKKSVWLSSEQFAKIRNTEHEYEFVDDSFDMFGDTDPNNFSIDIERAMTFKTYGPSFYKFIEMVKHADIIAIVTARGHESETLKNGCKQLINSVFTEDDKTAWHANIIEMLKKLGMDPEVILKTTNKSLFDIYWDFGFYFSVGAKKNEIYNALHKVEDLKQEKIKYIVRQFHDICEDSDLSVSIGFSDDDKSNLMKINDLFKELINIYPDTKFRLYDTSDRNYKKIVVEK